MIIDKLEHLDCYGIIAEEDQKAIIEFAKKVEEENLEECKVYLKGEELFAMVQIYDTKEIEDSLFESHEKYIDLQYIVSGKERFFVCDTSKGKVVKNQLKENDFQLLEGEEKIETKVLAGEFVLLFPWDAHMPCIRWGEKQLVKKIVYKLRVK